MRVTTVRGAGSWFLASVIAASLSLVSTARAQDGVEAEPLPAGALQLETTAAVPRDASRLDVGWVAAVGIADRLQLDLEGGLVVATSQPEGTRAADLVASVHALLGHGPEGSGLAFAVRLVLTTPADFDGLGVDLVAAASWSQDLLAVYVDLVGGMGVAGERHGGALVGVVVAPDLLVGPFAEVSFDVASGDSTWGGLVGLALRPADVLELRLAGSATNDGGDGTYEGRFAATFTFE